MRYNAIVLAIGLTVGFSGIANAEAVLKPPLHGLISMGNISFNRHNNQTPDNSLKYIYAKPGILDGVVLNFTWAQLQPKPDVLNTDVIDRALERVRVYNEKYPKKPLGVRLRIYAGPNAPDWVKRMRGAPVNIQHSGVDLTIGRFWTPQYGHAWRGLQEQLAKKYDTNPLINEVAMTSCSSVTSEPLMFAGGAVSLKNMHKAGFSDGKYRKCLAEAPDDFIFWQNTRIEYPINPFRLSDAGTPQTAPKITLSIMRKWHKTFGRHGVLSNHTLRKPAPAQSVFIFNAIKDIGPLIEFQVDAPTGLDWEGTIQYGITLGATAIEIWPETFTSLSAKKLKRWSAQIKHNQIP